MYLFAIVSFFLISAPNWESGFAEKLFGRWDCNENLIGIVQLKNPILNTSGKVFPFPQVTSWNILNEYLCFHLRFAIF